MYATTPLRSLSLPSSPLPITTKSTPPLASSFDRVGVVSNSNSKISPFFKLGLDFEPNWVFRASSSSLTRSKYVEEEEGLESSSSPVSVALEQILNESHFDRLLADAQQHHDSLVILWMAGWCRKCIYLKPKLEKLAAEYYPRIRFYCIDVNNVPHKLVVRAVVTKMPTIQVWKDSKKQAEMIGGHKAYLVVNEVREMIENEDPNV